MDIYHTIGEQIQNARREQGVGQKVLASLLEYTPSTISQYEKGKRCILLTDLQRIADALHLPLAYFLSSGDGSRIKKTKGFQVSLKEYKNIEEARKLKRKFGELEYELEKQKGKNQKSEAKIQKLMTLISEQAQITNQTTRLYNELKKSEEKARESEKITAVYKTIKRIAYQLNNPLSSLLGFIQLMIAEKSGNNSEDLKRLEVNTQRCTKVITELIDLVNVAPPPNTHYPTHNSQHILTTNSGAKQIMFKILVIDDEKDILELFQRVLKDYAVKTARDEKETLDWLNKEKFDLIFLDIVILQVNPLDFFRLIKKASPKSKIMLMTGFAVEEDINRLLKMGAVGVMRKPFEHIDEIKRAVERVLG